MGDPEQTKNEPQYSTTASQSEPAPPAELILLVQKVKTAATVDESRWTEANANLLLTTLNSLWMEAKGNDLIKGYIGEHIAQQLVHLAYSENIEISVSAAKLLRSITVNRKNKTVFQPLCRDILNVLKSATGVLRIPLTATIWNLSSIRPNREELMKDTILEVLAQLLCVPGELQGEAAGALRNLTLDDQHLEAFANTKAIDNLMSILGTLNIGPRVTCILNSIRNLSLKEKNHEKIVLGGTGIIALVAKLKLTSDPSDQRYILETFASLSKNEKKRPFLARQEIQELLIPFLTSGNEPLMNAAQTILNNLSISENVTKDFSKTQEIKQMMKQPDAYIKGLLENLDDNISEKDIILQRKVGEGAYGSVFLAEFNGYPVACKIIKSGITAENAKKILDELRVMRRLKHPNVVLLMGACLNSKHQIMIVTEFAARGDLKRCLSEVTSIAKRVDLVHDVATGLSWLQHCKIVHRDLKLDNLLVSEDWTVKITDFGLSIEMEEGTTWDRFGGNIKYSAPEILKVKYSKDNKKYAYGEKTDVYSFGLIWWQILTHGDPFVPRPDKYKSKEGLATFILEGNRPPLPQYWPQSLKTMVTNCWSQNPANRPSFRAVLDLWDKLTLDLLCFDSTARKVCDILWRDPKAKPDYATFKKTFLTQCMPTVSKLKDKESQMLESLCRDSPFDDSVSFSRFCYVVGWFGPLNNNCVPFFARMKDAISKPFFHGFLSDAQSDSKLQLAWESTSEKKSYYLVKYSMDSIGEFKLCYNDAEVSGRIESLVIRNVKGSLKVDNGQKYDDWKKLKTASSRVYNIGKHVPR
jgi:serine/threonine protein kinase